MPRPLALERIARRLGPSWRIVVPGKDAAGDDETRTPSDESWLLARTQGGVVCFAHELPEDAAKSHETRTWGASRDPAW